MATKTARIYAFLVPAPAIFNDNGEPPLVSIPFHRKDGSIWEIAILGAPDTIHAIRVTIPNCESDVISTEQSRAYEKLRTFLLDCIRINYDQNAEYLRMGDQIMSAWNFLEPGKPPSFVIGIEDKLNVDFRVNIEGLKAIIAAPSALRPILHLLADGINPVLPFQFRFLSCFKIIEMHYRPTTNKDFCAFLEPFVRDFSAIYTHVSDAQGLCKQLNKLRNKCAHIKLSSGDLGFSHLNAENDDLYQALKVLGRMAIRVIDINYPDSPIRFAETAAEAEARFEEMQEAGLRPVRVTSGGRPYKE